MITSLVVRKPSEISFGLALWRAGKPLLYSVAFVETCVAYLQMYQSIDETATMLRFTIRSIIMLTIGLN